jgi:hypothetical protein
MSPEEYEAALEAAREEGRQEVMQKAREIIEDERLKNNKFTYDLYVRQRSKIMSFSQRCRDCQCWSSI